MGVGVRQRAAIDRLEAIVRAHHRAPPQAPTDGGDERLSLCPELDCLRGWVSEDTAAAAGRRAFAIGTGADRVLISAGALDEEIYIRALADALGVAFEPLDDLMRDACPLDDAGLMDAPAAGMMPLLAGDDIDLLVAPRGLTARRLTELVNSAPHLRQRFRLTTSARLHSYAARHAADAIAERAHRTLAGAWPELSASPPGWRLSLIPAISIGAIGCVALLVAPMAVRLVFDIFLTLIFLAWMGLRIAGTLIWNAAGSRPARVHDRQLPTYTVLAPLYREAASIEELVAALRKLDYPGFMAQTPQAASR